MKKANVNYYAEVTPEEKAGAANLRDELEGFINLTAAFQETFSLFEASLVDVEKGTQFYVIANILFRFKQKIKEEFNEIIYSLAKVIATYRSGTVDSKMDMMRDLIVQNISECRFEFIQLLRIMLDFNEDNYVEECRALSGSINKYLDKTKEVIQDQWMPHIDYDVLGKIKLSGRVPLYIRK